MLSAFLFIHSWLVNLNPSLRTKLFNIIDSDPATQEIISKLHDFKGIEYNLLNGIDEVNLRGYISLHLINIALFKGIWHPNFLNSNRLDFDYAHPQNIETMEWFGSNLSTSRRAWLDLCESWNEQLKCYNDTKGDLPPSPAK